MERLESFFEREGSRVSRVAVFVIKNILVWRLNGGCQTLIPEPAPFPSQIVGVDVLTVLWGVHRGERNTQKGTASGRLCHRTLILA